MSVFRPFLNVLPMRYISKRHIQEIYVNSVCARITMAGSPAVTVLGTSAEDHVISVYSHKYPTYYKRIVRYVAESTDPSTEELTLKEKAAVY